MNDLVLLIGGFALLAVAYALYQRQRERDLVNRLKGAGRDPSAVLGEMDRAIADERDREEFWHRQNPR